MESKTAYHKSELKYEIKANRAFKPLRRAANNLVPPKTAEPKPAKPEASEPKPAEPEATEPKPAEPRRIEQPGVVQPEPAEPQRVVTLKTAEPRPTELEPADEPKAAVAAPAVAVALTPETKAAVAAPAVAVAPTLETKAAVAAPAVAVAPAAKLPAALLLTGRKCATYCKLMSKAYPAAVSAAAGQAWHDLVRRGVTKPSDLFAEWQPLAFAPAKKYGHYAAQVVFASQFADRAKLTQCFVEFAAECGFPAGLAHLEFADDRAPTPYAAGAAAQASNHYVFGDTPAYNFKKHAAKFSAYAVAAQAFEHVDPTTGCPTTVMWLYLPGKTWDGTSCFNFVKEVVGRYHGETNGTVLKARDMLTMTSEAKQALDHPFYVLRYLLLLPLALFLNLSATLWEQAAAQHEPEALQSSGDREMAFLNLDAAQSKEACAAFKAAGMPPTAGLLYAVSTAYRRTVGAYPFGINVQASLQTRAFAPVVKERAFIGDWLIGPCYKVRRLGSALAAAVGHGPAEYWTPADAKRLYAQLLHDVSTCTGAVRAAFVAREYGVVKGGPAPYQNQDLYGDLNRMNDSILFNNYGPREMHPLAKAVSWNWTGPGKLDCNTISVNGCTSVTLASTLMGLAHVTAIRDEMHAIIADLVAKNQAA